MSWLRVSMELDAGRVEAVEGLLDSLGALAVSVSDAGSEALLEPDPGSAPLWRACRLEALFDANVDASRLTWALEAAGEQPGTVEVLDDTDWSSRWRQHAVRECFGDRLWLLPRGDAPPTDRPVLRLDPGLAFGSGSHETTRLCLDWLARQPLDGREVLDFGCGSGVLGLAALALGCSRLLAVDHDPQALLATRDNAAYNALADGRLTVGEPELVAGRRFDVVLANILARPLMELAPRLAAALKPGGTLVLSGLLDDQLPAVAEAYPGLTFERPVFEADAAGARWARLVGVAPAGRRAGDTAGQDIR